VKPAVAVVIVVVVAVVAQVPQLDVVVVDDAQPLVSAIIARCNLTQRPVVAPVALPQIQQLQGGAALRQRGREEREAGRGHFLRPDQLQQPQLAAAAEDGLDGRVIQLPAPVESRWVSKPPAVSGKLRPRRLNNQPL
jgi:hypothetical protein